MNSFELRPFFKSPTKASSMFKYIDWYDSICISLAPSQVGCPFHFIQRRRAMILTGAEITACAVFPNIKFMLRIKISVVEVCVFLNYDGKVVFIFWLRTAAVESVEMLCCPCFFCKRSQQCVPFAGWVFYTPLSAKVLTLFMVLL